MKKISFAAALAVAALVLSGCSPEPSTSTATGEPIVVGSINALSGPVALTDASESAKAVFDEFNANGGLDGRPIKFVVLDDKSDPSAASTAARDAVESQGAVAMVGSSSLIECEVNGAYYEEKGIISIPGIGIDPVCYGSPNISPVNTGPYFDTLLTLTYGSEVLGLTSICGLAATLGSQLPAYKAAIDQWSEETGNELTMLDEAVPLGAADFTPQVVAVKEAGCDAIYYTGAEADGLGLLKAAQAQGLDDVTFLLLTSVYSAQFAKAAGFVGKGVYLPAEFLPFTDDAAGNEEWRALMEKYDVPLTSFGQGGYLAAQHFIEMLKTIKGDITSETVSAAFRAQTEGLDTPMTGTPWLFGPGDSHGSNTAAWPVKIEPGSDVWAQAGTDWITPETLK
jgi:branched-chain amino acid transport system substrate-binding protein